MEGNLDALTGLPFTLLTGGVILALAVPLYPNNTVHNLSILIQSFTLRHAWASPWTRACRAFHESLSLCRKRSFASEHTTFPKRQIHYRMAAISLSFSDIVTGVNLLSRVVSVLHDSSKAANIYSETINTLNVYQGTLQHLQDLRGCDIFTQSNVKTLHLAVDSANEHMNAFLAKHEKYGQTFRPEGSGNAVLDIQRKITWTIIKPGEVDKLMKTLSMLLLCINCSMACLLENRRMRIEPLRLSEKFRPTFDGRNIAIAERVGPSRSPSESIDPRFKVCETPSEFFRQGQIFSIFEMSHILIASLPPDEAGTISGNEKYTTEVSSFLGPVLIRRFLVVGEGYDSCLCLGVHTYGGRGCVGRVDQSSHARLYCGIPAPIGLNEEGVNEEEGILMDDIKVNTAHPSTVLSPKSRINFAVIYEVLHSCPVRPLGLVDEISAPQLRSFEASGYSLQNIQELEGLSIPREHIRIGESQSANAPCDLATQSHSGIEALRDEIEKTVSLNELQPSL